MDGLASYVTSQIFRHLISGQKLGKLAAVAASDKLNSQKKM